MCFRSWMSQKSSPPRLPAVTRERPSGARAYDLKATRGSIRAIRRMSGVPSAATASVRRSKRSRLAVGEAASRARSASASSRQPGWRPARRALASLNVARYASDRASALADSADFLAASASTRAPRSAAAELLASSASPGESGRHEQRADRRQHQDRREHAPQGRDHRVPPGPPPVAFRGADLPGLDRLVGQESSQIFGERLGRRVAAFGELVHRLQDDRLQVAGDAAVDRPRPGRLLVLDLLDEPEPVGRVVGRAERQQLVECHAQGVGVGPGVAEAAEPLRRHVAEGAEDVSGRGQAVVVGLGEAEVGDPDDSVGVEQEVRRLDVAVDDPPRMRVRQPLRRLSADLGDAPEERLAAAGGVDLRDVLAAGQDRRGRRPGLGAPRREAFAGGLGRVAPGGVGLERLGRVEARRERARRERSSTLAGDPAGQERLGDPAEVAPRVRDGATRPRVTSAGGPAVAGPRSSGGRPGGRTRFSSSMTWSSPWPWISCIA